jgi:CMP-N-acetylneuraminic acid synthetase
MSNTSFWKPVYQLFKPEEPLTTSEDLKNFYVQRTDSPVKDLVTTLEMEDDPAKFLPKSNKTFIKPSN